MKHNNTRDGEELLPGNVSEVVQVGNTIRRTTGPWSPAVHAVLQHLEKIGFDGAPRFLGIDDDGREVLTRLEGYTPPEAELPYITDDRLIAIGKRIRDLHQALADFKLPPGIQWHQRKGYIDDTDLPVCHLDIHPPNVVFSDGAPAGFIDWDCAHPAPLAWEIARAAWLLVPLATDSRCRVKGFVQPPDRLHRLRIFCDAYGLSDEDRRGFAKLAMHMAQIQIDQISSAAEAGVPSARWLADDVGYLRIVEWDIEWMRQSETAIDNALI